MNSGVAAAAIRTAPLACLRPRRASNIAPGINDPRDVPLQRPRGRGVDRRIQCSRGGGSQASGNESSPTFMTCCVYGWSAGRWMLLTAPLLRGVKGLRSLMDNSTRRPRRTRSISSRSISGAAYSSTPAQRLGTEDEARGAAACAGMMRSLDGRLRFCRIQVLRIDGATRFASAVPHGDRPVD